jgi:hypothetical protein
MKEQGRKPAVIAELLITHGLIMVETNLNNYPDFSTWLSWPRIQPLGQKMRQASRPAN